MEQRCGTPLPWPTSPRQQRSPPADALVRAAILAEVHPLRFVHPIVRAAIAEDHPPAQRVAAHRHAAELLRDDGEPAERIVPHLLQSAPCEDGWALETLRAAAGAAMSRGVPDLATRLLRRALDEPGAPSRADLLGELSTAELASGACGRNFASSRRRRCWRSRARRPLLSLVAWHLLGRDEPAASVRDLALRALADGRLIAEATVQTIAYYQATCALIEVEAYDDASDAIAGGMADTLARGSEYGYGGVCWMRGMLATREGDLAAAEADERTCIERAVPTMVGIGASALALVLLEQGDVDAAYRELERAGLLDDDRPLYVWGPYARGRVRLAQGNAAGALADFQDVGRHTTDSGGFTAGLPWQADAALALHALGDHEAAQRSADAELARALLRGRPRALGIALRTRGLVSSGEDRISYLTRAVDALETSRAKLELARGRCDLGVALARAGQRRAGRQLLEQSHDVARACGAKGLVRTTHDELVVAGARPRRLMFSGVEALTPSERRVAEMAADGLTNREIAQTLFVTAKTVENQLGRAFSKLGLSSRRELGAALGPPAPEADTRET